MEKKKEVNKWIIALCLTLFFSFFIGYYISYRVNEKSKTKLDIIQKIMEEEWYYGLDDENIEETLQTKMILGMIDLTKDPYTRYLTSLGTLADSYRGIGISAAIYGEYFIVEEVSSLHAKEDGVKKGDIILEVNGVSIKNKTLEDLNNLILGGESNNVSLKVSRNNQEVVIYTAVETYDPLTIFTKEYDSVAYVKISEFNFDTASYLNEYFYSLPGEMNLVLDLRGNPGGYISSVQEVLDLFLGKNKVVMSTINKQGEITYVRTVDDSCYFFEKIVVLIDENTASGAEALAAALDYHLDDKVILYGNTTYGKGSAQRTISFSDGTYFHYTYALWNTPDGTTINKIGVAPEISSVNKGISSLPYYGAELKLYDYHSDVYLIQTILKNEGLYTGELHSFMDEETVEAIKAFQVSNALQETGNIDMQTIRYVLKMIYDDEQNYLNNELVSVLGSMFS